MQYSADQILTILREQKPYLEEHFGVTKLALFGSYARGDFSQASDIDILIELKKKSFTTRFLLKEYLEHLFSLSVDVVYFDAVRRNFMRSMQKDIIYA
jgi:predicted nucleotidyltransferase